MPAQSLYDDSDHWRSRAQQIRVIAAGMRQSEAKEIMLEIAVSYDRIAARSERRYA